MKKYSRIIALLLAVALVLPGAGLAAKAEEDANEVHRLYGANRYETAVEVSKEAYPTTAKNVILASGESSVDALTGTSLAGKLDAPILYTTKGELHAATKAQLKALGAETVHLLGGPGVISEAVKTELEGLSYKVERISGQDRAKTAVEVARKLGATHTRAYVVTDGLKTALADALAVAPVSHMLEAPVFLTGQAGLTPATKAALEEFGVTHVTIIGGEVAVSTAVETELKSLVTVNRIKGGTRAETAVKIAEELFTTAPTKAVLANGWKNDLVDALAGGYLGGKMVAPILYATKAGALEKATEEYLDTTFTDVYVLGGTGVVTTAAEKAALEAISPLEVKSVSAINGAQVEVKFNAKVDETTAETQGNYTATGLDSQTATTAQTAELKEDGKTVVVTFNNPLAKRYQFKVTNVQLASDANITVNYDDIVTFKADTTAPTATVERVSTNSFKIKFSEPMKASAGSISTKYADGTAGAPVLSVPASTYTEIAVDLSAATDNKNIEITLNGVADMAGNLINPQPTKLTVVKLPNDGIEPAITSVTQTGAKTFSIKFNKDLDGTTLAFGDVTVGSTAATAMKKISASEYEFTMAANLDGLQTVTVAANKAVDLAGQKNTNPLTKLVTFKADTVAPKATAQLVKVDGTEYIELTFDKDVNLTAGTTKVDVAGKQVKNYVTTTVGTVNADVDYKNASNKKVVLVELSGTGLSVEGAAYDLTLSANSGSPIKSLAGVDMEDVKVQFTRGKDEAAANSHVVTSVGVSQGTTPDEVLFTFTIPSGTSLDGATATNKSNYVIAGAQVDSISLAAASGTTQVATVKLVKGSNTFTGTRNITVQNVKVEGSTKVMDPVTINNVTLAENVAPTITEAKLTSNTTIVLTFSENVKGAGGLEVFVGDTKLTDKGTLGTGKHTETDVSSTAANKITITLDSTDAIDAADIAKGVKVKVVSGTALTDVTGETAVNKLAVTTVNVIQ